MSSSERDPKGGLLARLAEGPVICSEGYLFALERQGYVQAGPFVPLAVLEHPEVVQQLHRDFVRAGSDVVEAFTYYAHREKLKLVDRTPDLERLNRRALQIAREVARETGTMLAGDICHTNIYSNTDKSTQSAACAMFEEQVGWAVEEGADFIIAETFSWAQEALIAVEVVKQVRLPVVATLAVRREPVTREGWTLADACKRLEDAGADVVGLNCYHGPATMLPLLGNIRRAVKCHVAALPVPYRTTEQEPTFMSLRDPGCDCLPGEMPFPLALDPFYCHRFEIAKFAREVYALGVKYLGVCCGAMPHQIRSMAEALGRTPPGSACSPDMSTHVFFGTAQSLNPDNLEYGKEL
ncbi:MAG TPA: homocysteine S-methyltransferase family protein [Burkholderiales bacterium]|nr:homocysteine S-methyltransferase family protein [Burkholderiales bacterium]